MKHKVLGTVFLITVCIVSFQSSYAAFLTKSNVMTTKRDMVKELRQILHTERFSNSFIPRTNQYMHGHSDGDFAIASFLVCFLGILGPLAVVLGLKGLHRNCSYKALAIIGLIIGSVESLFFLYLLLSISQHGL